MPKARAYCGRAPLHLGTCRSSEAVAKWAERSRSRDRVVTPEDKARWARTHKLKRYGLTEETFTQLLEAQGYACAMCFEPFAADQLIFIDHDHNLGCHPGEKQACDRCRRGLLCLRCNTGLGYIERMGEMARAYLIAVSGARLRLVASAQAPEVLDR